jgi:EpsI family protein
MEKSGARNLVYYWFPQRGRILTNLYQVKLYNFWDALTRHRTDGALVRLITPVYQGEAPGEAEARLQGFTRQIMPVLERYLPK